MEYSPLLIHNLLKPFVDSFQRTPTVLNNGDYNISKGNVFGRWLSIDFKASSFELPLVMRGNFEAVAAKRVRPDLLVSYIAVGNSNLRRTAERAVLSMFASLNFLGLAEIRTPKGDLYYGLPGMILDRQFNPLMSCAIRTTYNFSANRWEYNEFICRISPQVFENNRGFIENFIIKKIIPVYTIHGVNVHNFRVEHYGSFKVDSNITNGKIKVLVEDFNIFTTPQVPEVGSPINDDINNFLESRNDSIIGIMSET